MRVIEITDADVECLLEALDAQIPDEEEVLERLTVSDKTPETPEEFLAVVTTQQERLDAFKTLRDKLKGD